jgi:hypothetical protein
MPKAQVAVAALAILLSGCTYSNPFFTVGGAVTKLPLRASDFSLDPSGRVYVTPAARRLLAMAAIIIVRAGLTTKKLTPATLTFIYYSAVNIPNI